MLSSESLKINQLDVGNRIKIARNDAKLTQSELAIEAGTTPQSWGKYEDGTVSPRLDVLLPLTKRGYSLDWIFTGEGEMQVEQKSLTPEEKPIRDYGKNPVTPSVLSSWSNESSAVQEVQIQTSEPAPQHNQNETFNESDMIDQTLYVLRSNTVYRGALASNIKAFHKAVRGEKEMEDVIKRMSDMQEQLNRMEIMFQRYVGEPAQKKKEIHGNSGE